MAARALRRFLLLLVALVVVPLALNGARKLRTTGHSGLLVTAEEGGWRLVSEGAGAGKTGLKPGDLILLIDGEEARRIADPVRFLEAREREVTVLREGFPLRLRTQPFAAPWNARYVVLLLVGATFLGAAAAAARQSAREGDPGPALLYAAFSLGAGMVLILTPAPPFDAFFRATTLAEDVARGLFPAFLLAFLFSFPRRVRGVPPAAFFVPAALLVLETAHVYLFPGADSGDATARVVRLDRLEAIWIGGAIVAGTVRLALLSRRRIDLLAEKQVRFLLAGTACGLLPVAVLDLLPQLLGGPIPILSTLSILPLALVPFAFLAALTRYRLWDVDVLVRETTALLGAGFLSAALFASSQLVDARAFAPALPYAQGLLETAAGLAVALTFLPVRRGLSGALARVQYGERLPHREGLLALVRELSRPRRLGEIGPLLAGRVASGLGVSRAALLLSDGDGILDAREVDGGAPIPLSDLPPGTASRTVRLSRLLFAAQPSLSITRLRRAGFRTLAPLAISGRLLGVLAVGDRDGREPLSAEDVELLETVLASAALALDHARLYEALDEKAEEYRRLKELHEDVVTGSSAAIAATDEEGRLASVNPAFERLFGGGPLGGRLAGEVLPARLLSVASTDRVEVEAGGTVRTLDVTVSPFPGSVEGSPARVYVVTDVTERVRLEAALAERDRLAALSTLSAGVAHEVNTPLTGVASFARLLVDETPLDDPRRSIAEKIERQAFRAARLVGSLLDLARGRPRELSPLAPRHLADEACRALEDEIGGRGVALELDVPLALPSVLGHSDALVQVFVNLLKNAVEAVSAPGQARSGAGRVRFTARGAGDAVLFTVEDDGPGLSPEAAARVFTPFYSTKALHGGVGLGLAIASDIIRAHGGQLAVDSSPGQGARFTVTLPARA